MTRKMTYWVADCLHDSKCYSIREKTKKAVLDVLQSYEDGDYDKPRKVTVCYSDLMHLLQQAIGEGGIE